MWPMNFVVLLVISVLSYCVGRVHQSEVDVRPIVPLRAFVPSCRQRKKWRAERLDINPAMRKRQRIPAVRS